MNESIVICRTPGCSNVGVAINILTDEFPPVNVVCGPCQQEITDIKFIKTIN